MSPSISSSISSSISTSISSSISTTGSSSSSSSISSWLPVAAALLLQVPPAEALAEPELCYVLDGILFLYGIVLTVLYCRLKFVTRRVMQEMDKKPEEGIYTGLSAEHQETYEMLQHKP